MKKRHVRASRRRSRRRYVILLILGLVAVGTMVTLMQPPFSQTTTHVADPDNAKQVAIGQAVYARSCANCHGANLEGQPRWKQPLPTGGYPAPPHDATGHTWHHPDALLFKITKYGGQASAPRDFRSNMPPFQDVLTDTEIWAVLAYIKSRWPAAVRAKQTQMSMQAR